MHMHGIQSNLIYELDSLNAAARAEAKKAAERTRAELRRMAASSVEGFDGEDDFVVSLAGREDPQRQQNGRNQKGDQRQEQRQGGADESFSGYA